MNERLWCYLRTHRRLWGLSQRELAFLLGFESGSQVSKLEKSKRTPKVRVAIACQVIFGIPPATLFPNLYDKVEKDTMTRVYQFYQGIEQGSTSSDLRKKELCERALKRATGGSSDKQNV
jgi:transcriptional regulator with XRE-family HTH domain